MGDDELETPLTGGRTTTGVVRVGDTVRRPPQPNSPFVRLLLDQLVRSGFDGSPRALGSDEQGREAFTYLEGEVPADLDPMFSDEVIEAAARLIRRFHDATAGSELAGSEEVVCHNDLTPVNFVFRDGLPVAMIDFDRAAPGSMHDDLGYAVFLWLCLGYGDGPPVEEQARRIRVFCASYGTQADERLMDAIVDAVARTVERTRDSPGAGRRPVLAVAAPHDRGAARPAPRDSPDPLSHDPAGAARLRYFGLLGDLLADLLQ